MMYYKAFKGLIGMIILFILIFTSVKAGNDFITVDLRTDVPEVLNSLDYRVWIASGGGPTGNYPTFTTAWISVYLDNQPGLYGVKFSQVGLMADSQGIYWFVYAEPGVECWRGSRTYWNAELNKFLGCKGDIGDLVDYGQFFKVELVTYGEGFWIARVEDSQGNPYDVAKILSNSTNIYDADVNMEEGWSQAQDPFEFGSFHLWHPQYNSWVNGFMEWPISDNVVNRLYAAPASICPQHYGAWTNKANDPRYWVAGSGGNVCNAIMFPANKVYLPLVIND